MNKNSGVKHLVVIAFALWLTSCNIINPDEEIPSVLHLSPFTFQIEPGQGSGDNKVTEVWVYANGNNLGAFSPPVDVHFFEEGLVNFVLRPGIRNNGIADDAIIYPMFEGYSFDYTASPGSELDVQPVTRYKTNTVFSLISDFELINDFVDNRDTNLTSTFVRSQVDVYEGAYSGQMTVTPDGRYAEVTHTIAIGDLPVNASRPTYLEMRYKNEVDFYVGILGLDLNGNNYSKFFFRANPSTSWKMIYLNLTDYILESGLPAYKIVFSTVYPSTSTLPQYNIFLDNIKVVHL